MAAPTVEFLGRVSDAELPNLYGRARALILPGEEDFGITTVEALASGKPVIALGCGGELETAAPCGGILYQDGSEKGLAEALERFEQLEPQISPGALQEHARRFSPAEFTRKMNRAIEELLGSH
jgi:glycosyltransferase involved in cell wall biosynthesis